MASVSTVNTTKSSLSEVYETLQSLPPPLLPPGKATDSSLTDKISSLYVHPSIEIALHLLNADLPSAHFLCRHMQAAPQYEGMYLHGILHRIEGDYDNARAWYGDVAESDVFKAVWATKEEALKLIARVEALHESVEAEPRDELAKESVREIKAVAEFCMSKFGTGRVDDASQSWKQPGGELKQLGEDMVSGSKGFRDF